MANFKFVVIIHVIRKIHSEHWLRRLVSGPFLSLQITGQKIGETTTEFIRNVGLSSIPPGLEKSRWSYEIIKRDEIKWSKIKNSAFLTRDWFSTKVTASWGPGHQSKLPPGPFLNHKWSSQITSNIRFEAHLWLKNGPGGNFKWCPGLIGSWFCCQRFFLIRMLIYTVKSWAVACLG